MTIHDCWQTTVYAMQNIAALFCVFPDGTRAKTKLHAGTRSALDSDRSADEGKSAMKFAADRPLADPDAAARKLVEIANDVEAEQDGRIHIERVNEPFLAAGGSGEQFRAGIERAVALGWLWRHESGTYV